MKKSTGIRVEDITDEHTMAIVGAMEEAGVPLSKTYAGLYASSEYVRKRLVKVGANPLELRVNSYDQNKVLYFDRGYDGVGLVVDLMLDPNSPGIREAGGVEQVEEKYEALFDRTFPQGSDD